MIEIFIGLILNTHLIANLLTLIFKKNDVLTISWKHFETPVMIDLSHLIFMVNGVLHAFWRVKIVSFN